MANSVIHKGRLIELHKEQVPLREGGNTFFDVVKHPGGAVIIAINDRNEVCLLKQWRHAIDEHIWELPAGCLEIDEAPIKTAARELEEEAGVVAKSWRDLGIIVPSPGFSNEKLYIFEAKGIAHGSQNLDDAEQLEVHWIPANEVMAMVDRGEISDAKTLCALLKAKVWK